MYVCVSERVERLRMLRAHFSGMWKRTNVSKEHLSSSSSSIVVSCCMCVCVCAVRIAVAVVTWCIKINKIPDPGDCSPSHFVRYGFIKPNKSFHYRQHKQYTYHNGNKLHPYLIQQSLSITTVTNCSWHRKIYVKTINRSHPIQHSWRTKSTKTRKFPDIPKPIL